MILKYFILTPALLTMGCASFPGPSSAERLDYSPAIEADFRPSMPAYDGVNVKEMVLSENFGSENFYIPFEPDAVDLDAVSKMVRNNYLQKFGCGQECLDESELIGFYGQTLRYFGGENFKHNTVRAQQVYLLLFEGLQYGARQKCWYGKNVDVWTTKQCPEEGSVG